MRRITALASILGAAVFMTASAAYAAKGDVRANLANGEKIFKEGKGSVPACNSCHGEDGMGNDMMGTPRLAGQVAQFIIKQLDDFRNDRRMDTTMFAMNANAKGLTPQDSRDIAAYVNSLPGGAKPSHQSNLEELASMGTEVGTPYIGKSIVLYGISEKGVPACRSCHGYAGRGVDPVYPKINQQKFNYLVNQLKKWRDGSRANDPRGQMRAVARKLSDADILNAASYLVNASSYVAGNSGLPEEHPFMAYDPH